MMPPCSLPVQKSSMKCIIHNKYRTFFIKKFARGAPHGLNDIAHNMMDHHLARFISEMPRSRIVNLDTNLEQFPFQLTYFREIQSKFKRFVLSPFKKM